MPAGSIQGRVLLNGTLMCVTGLRVGAGTESLEIGGLDMPVVRDPVTREPYLPGSSQRGKLRSLMEKRRLTELSKSGEAPVGGFFNKNLATTGPAVRHHECNEEGCVPCRVFGVSTDQRAGVTQNRPGRLIVRDSYLLPRSLEELRDMPTGQYTEVKYENSLDRITSAAQPRQVERIPRGARFGVSMVYSVEDLREAAEDLCELLVCLRLLEDDYLGGCGSRGYGQVRFEDLTLVWRSKRYYEGADEEKTTPVDLRQAPEKFKELLQGLLGGSGR